MAEIRINDDVRDQVGTIPIPTKVETWLPSPDYRWCIRVRRGAEQKVLQRAYYEQHTGRVRWEDVPEVREENSDKA